MSKVKDLEHPNLYLDTRTGIYYVRKYMTGLGRLDQSLKEKNRSKAVRRMNQVLKSWISKPHGGNNLTLGDVYIELEEIYKMKATQTYKNFESICVNHVLPYFIDTPLNQVAPQMKAYVAHQKSKNPERKLAHDIKHIHAILNHSVDLNYITGYRKYKLDESEKAPAPGRELTNQEINKILKAANRKLRLQLKLQLYCGMRSGEVRQLKKDYINFNKETITLPGGVVKTRKSRTYPVPSDLLKEIKDHCKTTDSPYVFPHKNNPEKPETRSDKTWQRLKDKIGIDVKQHWLRHTVATRYARAGVPAIMIKRALGMSERVLEQVYLHSNEEDAKKLKNVMRDSLRSA